MPHTEFEISREISLSDALPSDAEIRSMLDHGVSRILLAPGEHVSLSTEDESHLGFLRLLRDCASWGISVDWRAAHESGYPLQELVHLPPPNEDSATRSAWDGEYRFGKMFWRNGPGFVLVKDTRDSDRSARFTLDDPESLSVFFACQRPTDILAAATTPKEREVLLAMIEERVVFRVAESVLVLAVRARRWPIPYMSV